MGVGAGVSILTRPEGRVQRVLPWRPYRSCRSFNPHPAFWPGATSARLCRLCRSVPVSILTRPEGRVQRADRGALAPRSMKVSILTRPEGRVQPVYPQHAQRWVLLGFNPHPAFWPGATWSSEPGSTASSSCFNPHPARRPGATIDGYANIAVRIMVSILTRPEGRVQHCAGAASSMERGFQSSPG